MDKEVKEMQSEDVRYKARMAAGAWVNGEQMKEKGTATMPLANSDHGNFSEPKGVDKRNA
jgi:hypothetical protein